MTMNTQLRRTLSRWGSIMNACVSPITCTYNQLLTVQPQECVMQVVQSYL